MKKLIVYLLAILACNMVAAQTITAYRYWYDNGFANASTVTGSFGTNYNLQADFSVNSLSDGLHSFNIAFKESTNKWSLVSSSFFYKQTSTAVSGQSQYQYWFDNDFTNATNKSIGSTNDYSLIADLDVNSLLNGLHSLNIRFRPDGGLWSSVTSSFFYKRIGSSNANITGYQYWFDNNVLDSVTVNTTPSTTLDFTTDINTGSLSNGLHAFNIRFKQSDGLWSVVKSEFFENTSAITSNNKIKTYRYWFDNNSANYKEVFIGELQNDAFAANVDVESLSNGLHTITSMFKDANGLWSIPVTSFFTRGEITNKEFVYPKIYLEKVTITLGVNTSISGTDYTPNGPVKMLIKTINNDFIKDTIISATSDGKISLNNKFISNLPPGKYQVYSLDVNTQRTSYTATFNVISGSTTTSASKYLHLNAPTQSSCFYTNNPITIQWSDKAIKQNNLVPNTSKVKLLYRLEYSKNDGPWILIKYHEQDAFINSNVQLSDSYTPTTGADGIYKFRVTDAYNSINSEESLQITVGEVSNGFTYSLIWDHSGQNGIMAPIGVCADGTSRLYIKVTKKNSQGKSIESVKAEVMDLSNPNNGIDLTGKIKFATDVNKYSLEGNAANLQWDITHSPSLSGEYWFWYVAPDNFTRDEEDNFQSSRKVDLQITVKYTDNSNEVQCGKLEIVRPPLMLVHGIASDEHTWDDFTYTYKSPYDGSQFPVKFIDNFSRWKYVAAIHLGKADAFIKNSRLLLALDDNNQATGYYNNQSFQYFLKKMRAYGYACNRVDYVCHSMGGSVARNAISEIPTEYNPPLNYNRRYKNYGKGFINKFISINTPHNGTPWGDIALYLSPVLSAPGISEDFSKLYDIPVVNNYVESFYKKIQISYIPSHYVYIPTDAVLNLRFGKGGVKFPITNIKNHLISGDLESGNESCSEYFWNFYHDPNLQFFDKLLGYSSSIGCVAINSLFGIFGVDDMLENSDAVVPLRSQLPGKVNNLSSPNLSRFDGFSSNHVGIKNRLDVGNKVMTLLNASITSPYFDNTIAANNSDGPNNLRLVDRVGQSEDDSANNNIRGYVDTQKIKILQVFPGAIDSVIKVNIRLIDTINLKKAMILFEGTPYNSQSRNKYQNFEIQSSPYTYGKKIIVASAVYDSSGYSVYHSDTASFTSDYDSSFTNFFVTPNTKQLLPGEVYMPSLNALHNHYSINVSNFDSMLQITVADTNVVVFDNSLRKIIAKDTGSTYAIITYKNFRDTIYFLIADSKENTDITFMGKVYLQGDYNTSTNAMNNTLNSLGILQTNATTQPYTSTQFNYTRVESVSSTFFTSHPDIVDWVLLELRDSANPSSVVASKAAFVKQDGTLVETDGTNNRITFEGVDTGKYFIAIRHRNHLGIRSSTLVDFSSGSGNYDFTTSADKAYQNQSYTSTVQVGNVWAMRAGNAGAGTNVKYNGPGNAQNQILNIKLGGSLSQIISSAYAPEDINMDGTIKWNGPGNDQNFLLNIILGGSLSTIYNEQL